MDRSDWKVPTPAEAISAARVALRAVNSPYAEVSFEADLLEYVDDGVWLVSPGWGAPDDADISVTVDVRSGAVELGGYVRTTIKDAPRSGE